MFSVIREAGRDWLAGFKKIRCDDPSCHRSFTAGFLKTRNVGITMGKGWYCSPRCLYAAAEKEFAAVLGTRQHYASSKPTRSLGLELVGRNLLTPERLHEINEQVSSSQRDQGDLLVESRYVTEAQVAATRAAIWNCPVYNPPAAIINSGIHIPPVLAASCLVLPMHYVCGTRQQLLGFLRSVDYELMFALEKMTGCRAVACFVKPSDFFRHEEHLRMKNLQTEEAPGEMIFAATDSASDRARLLCKHCTSLDAHQVKITLCKNYLWARVQGGSGVHDLLFKVD